MRNKNLNERLRELKQIFVPRTAEEKGVSTLIAQTKAAILQFENAWIKANKNLDKLKKLHQKLKPLYQDEANDKLSLLDKEIQLLEQRLKIQASYPDLAKQVIVHALQKYNDMGGQLQLGMMDYIMATTSANGAYYLTNSDAIMQKNAKRIADDTLNRSEQAADRLKNAIDQLGLWKKQLTDDINTKQIGELISEVTALIHSKKKVNVATNLITSPTSLALEDEAEPELDDTRLDTVASRLRLEISVLKNEMSRKLLHTPESDANYLNVLDDIVMYNDSLADMEKTLVQAMSEQTLSDDELSRLFINDIHLIHYTLLDFLCASDRYSIDILYPSQQHNLEGYSEQALKLADELADAKQLMQGSEEMLADLTEMGRNIAIKLTENEAELLAKNKEIEQNNRALGAARRKVESKGWVGAFAPNKKFNQSIKKDVQLRAEKELIQKKNEALSQEASENQTKILKLERTLPTIKTRMRTIGDALANVELQISVSIGQIQKCKDEIQRLQANIHATEVKLMNIQNPLRPSFVLRFLSYLSSLFVVFFLGAKKSTEVSEASLRELMANDQSKLDKLEKKITQLLTKDPHLDHDVNQLKLNAVEPMSSIADQAKRARDIDAIIERCEKKQFGGHQKLTFGIVAHSYSESELVINSLLRDYLKLMKNNNPLPAKTCLDALNNALRDYQRELNGRPPNHRIMINVDVAREHYPDLLSVSRPELNKQASNESKKMTVEDPSQSEVTNQSVVAVIIEECKNDKDYSSAENNMKEQLLTYLDLMNRGYSNVAKKSLERLKIGADDYLQALGTNKPNAKIVELFKRAHECFEEVPVLLRPTLTYKDRLDEIKNPLDRVSKDASAHLPAFLSSRLKK